MIYERKSDTMHNPPHPGEILKEDCLEPLGLTITDFAKKIGVTRKTISDIVNKKTGISPAMSLKLAKTFNTSAELWLGMQTEYDLWRAKQTTNLDNVEVVYKHEAA